MGRDSKRSQEAPRDLAPAPRRMELPVTEVGKTLRSKSGWEVTS